MGAGGGLGETGGRDGRDLGRGLLRGPRTWDSPAVCPVWMAPTVAVAMGDTSFGPMMSSAVSRPRDPVVVFVTLACGTTAGLVCTAVVLAGGACLTIIGSTGPKEPWGTAADLVTLVCGIAVGLARGCQQ